MEGIFWQSNMVAQRWKSMLVSRSEMIYKQWMFKDVPCLFVYLLHIVHEKTSDHNQHLSTTRMQSFKGKTGFSINQYEDFTGKINRAGSKEQKVGFCSYPSLPELVLQLPKPAEFLKQNLHFTPELHQNFRRSLLNVSETNISSFTTCYIMSVQPLMSAPFFRKKQKTVYVDPIQNNRFPIISLLYYVISPYHHDIHWFSQFFFIQFLISG